MRNGDAGEDSQGSGETGCLTSGVLLAGSSLRQLGRESAGSTRRMRRQCCRWVECGPIGGGAEVVCTWLASACIGRPRAAVYKNCLLSLRSVCSTKEVACLFDYNWRSPAVRMTVIEARSLAVCMTAAEGRRLLVCGMFPHSILFSSCKKKNE
jgi:hypothetical protein